VHVIDDRAADEVKRSREGYILHRQLQKHQVSSMQRADEAGAAGILERATTTLGRGDQGAVERRVLRGHPEREVVQLARDDGVDVVIVFGRRHHGPKSIGKAARFIVDHVPCTVMVVRAEGVSMP
jgi:nucleotide-binding universal stress UspA family protein